MTDVMETESRAFARLAGSMYLITMSLAIFGEFFVRSRLLIPGDIDGTMDNVVSHELLFRIGVAVELITAVGVVVLVFSLYMLLRTADRKLALLGLLWRLVEAAILGLVLLFSIAALELANGPEYLSVFSRDQLNSLAGTFLRVQSQGHNFALVFLGFGSATFSYILFRSRYVPRLLSGLGIFASLFLAVVTISIIVFPSISIVFSSFHYLPIFLFEVILGVWLILKGVDLEAVTSARDYRKSVGLDGI